MCFKLHGLSSDLDIGPSALIVGCMSSHASQSSNSGCEGGSLCIPKSSGVVTIPMPKYACHKRFTTARAVVGERLSTSHFAKVRRELQALSFWSLRSVLAVE